jgi:hypothetical protein
VLWAGSKPHDVYLGTRAVAVSRGTTVGLLKSVEGLEGALTLAENHLRQLPGRPKLRLWLSGGLCRPFVMPAVAAIGDINEAMKVASKLCAEKTGLIGECTVWLEAAKRDQSRIVVALETSTLLEIQKRLGACGRVVSVRPWWAEVLRLTSRGAEPVTALGVQDCDSLTVLVGASEKVTQASTSSPVMDVAAAQAAFARALMSAGTEPIEALLAQLKVLGSRPETQLECALGGLLELSR